METEGEPDRQRGCAKYSSNPGKGAGQTGGARQLLVNVCVFVNHECCMCACTREFLLLLAGERGLG